MPPADSPFIAPMKINFLKSSVLRNKARYSFALLASLFSIWLALTPGLAQSKNQKRITSLQIGEVNEGSRVTVFSDSALNDYEAFRRGDRFYVRIPLADFTATKPGFKGDGFEDVQVEKVGDSVVVSFKLQPGATARVDQRSNRLDVIFSSPNRVVRSNRTYAESNRGSYLAPDGIVRVNRPQTSQRRERDAAGPVPPGSPGSSQGTRERVVAARTSDFQTPRSQSTANNPREDSGRRGSNRADRNMGTSKPVPSSTVTKSGSASGISQSGSESGISKSGPESGISKSGSASGISKSGSASGISKSAPLQTVPKYEPSPTSMPSTSPGYPALASSTPAAPVASQSPLKSTGLTSSPNGKSRSDIALEWMKANRQATLLGALFLLGLLVLLAALLFRRRKNAVKAKGRGTHLSQPKPSTQVDVNNPTTPISASASGMTSRDSIDEEITRPRASEATPLAVPVSANAPRTSANQEKAELGKPMLKPAMARSAAAAPPTHAWVPASSSKGSSKNEDQEREVFEL